MIHIDSEKITKLNRKLKPSNGKYFTVNLKPKHAVLIICSVIFLTVLYLLIK